MSGGHRRHLRFVTFYRPSREGRGLVPLSVPFADLPTDLVERYLLALDEIEAVENAVAEFAGYRWDDENGWTRR